MRALRTADVAIVGLGLMGGSLAGALHGECRTVVGVARRQASIDTAIARDLIDRGTTDLVEGVGSANVVVLATPVRVIVQQLEEIAPHLPNGCLVMDVGSTKTEIVEAMHRLPRHVQPLGAHPMCGKEVAGIEAAEPTLYEGCTFVLTPLERTSEEALALGKRLVNAVGGRPLVLTPERQDRLVATISHLPYLLSCALVGTAEQIATIDDRVWEVAASGFRDTSRLAASDVTMMLDILLTNRDAVLEMVDRSLLEMQELRHLIESANEERLRVKLERIQRRRSSWGDSHGG